MSNIWTNTFIALQNLPAATMNALTAAINAHDHSGNGGVPIPGAALTTLGGISAGAGTIPAANLPSIAGIVPSGGIIMWSGSLASAAALAPTWYLCDGTNGTPDLRDKFIVAASSDVVGIATTIMTDGVTKTQSGASNFAAHTHLAPNANVGAPGGPRCYENGGQQSPTGSAGSGTVTYPPYYALAFLMKN